MVRIIAIDGPVAAGKTVVGRAVAERLGFWFLDTGVMYRAVTWLALREGAPLNDEEALGALAEAHTVQLVSTDSSRVAIAGHEIGPELREPEVEGNVSQVSKASPVRRALVARQRAIAAEGEIVMTGRDIGTVVLPDAGLKVYLLASAEQRARRRWQETRDRGRETAYETVLQETRDRDAIDSSRNDSPLRPAADAWRLDTGHLTIDEVVDRIVEKAGDR
jgi:cytidylate kinase